MYQEGHATPGFGAGTIKGNRENHFRRLVVVGQEQLVVVAFEGITCASDFVAIRDTLRILGRANVHFSVEVQLCQKGPCCSFVGAAILVFAGIQQFGFDGFQLRFYIAEQLGTRGLAGQERTNCIGFGDKRYVAKHVQSVVVAQSAQEAGFGTEYPRGSLVLGADAPIAEFSVGGLADELVAQGDLVKNPVVHRRDELVARGPVHVVVIGQTAVVPANNGLIGRQLLRFPVLTQIGTKAFVDAADVGASGGALLATYRQTCIHFGQDLFVVAKIFVDRSGSHFHKWGAIQVFGAGADYHEDGQGSQFYAVVEKLLFHHFIFCLI